MLIAGKWSPDIGQVSPDGAFTRVTDAFGEQIECQLVKSIRQNPNRYFLIVSLSCPWSHRVTLASVFLQTPLTKIIAGEPRDKGYSILHTPSAVRQKHGSIPRLHRFYTIAHPTYSGRATVPVLWDNQTGKILSNNSGNIVKALDASFGKNKTLYPAERVEARETLMDRLYFGLSNAVYEAGFAQNQTAYDDAAERVFDTLGYLEERLSSRRFLMGNNLTVADVHLFPTLVRFDLVYGPFFQCTKRRLKDYPKLWAYLQRIYALPSVASTIDIDAIMTGYYLNDTDRNPHRIISQPPELDFGSGDQSHISPNPPKFPLSDTRIQEDDDAGS